MYDFYVDKIRDCVKTHLSRITVFSAAKEEKCPSSPDSWCPWQRASAMNTLSSFKHDYDPLPSDVSSAIKPIYEELSKEELLERWVGGFT